MESYADISWTGVRLLYDLCIVFVSVYCYCVFAISVHDSQRHACYGYYTYTVTYAESVWSVLVHRTCMHTVSKSECHHYKLLISPNLLQLVTDHDQKQVMLQKCM